MPAGWNYSEDKIGFFGDAGDVVHIESDDVTQVINSSSGATISLPADLDISVSSNYMRQIALPQKGTIYVSSKYNLKSLMFFATSINTANENTEMKVLGTLDDFTYKNNPGDVTELRLAGTKITGNISSVSRLPNLQLLNLLRLNIEGSVKSIANLTNLTSLTLQDTNVEGSAIDLGVFINANTIGFLRSKITGSVEDLVSSQISHGKLTRSASDSPLRSNGILTQQLTFGGKNWTNNISNGIVIWGSASKIAVYTGPVFSIEGSTHVYCKGYTQEEAEAAFSGKTIIRVDA